MKKIQSIYAQRAAFTVLSLEREIKGLAEWINPKCGMFLVGGGDHSDSYTCFARLFLHQNNLYILQSIICS